MIIRDLLRFLPFERFRNPAPSVTVIRLHGVIGGRGRGALTLARKAAAIERAFTRRHVQAVALSINSPGGSPVQSALIFRRIRQLAEEKDLHVFAFAEDVAASGGYWLALAGDELFAEETSILGSVGVVSASFGFTELMRRIGISRRLYTSGERKALLDPFLTEDPQGVERLSAIQADIHESFKDVVRSRRAGKLKSDDTTVFAGEVFAGRRALELGLIDGIGEIRGILRQRFGDKVRIHVVDEDRRRLFPLRLPFFLRRRQDWAEHSGDVASQLLATVEERLFWNRFGL